MVLQVQFTGEAAGGGEGEGMVRQLQDASRPGVDDALRCGEPLAWLPE